MSPDPRKFSRQTICFYFPADGPGGAQTIVIRLALEFYRMGKPFIVFDKPLGYISGCFPVGMSGHVHIVDDIHAINCSSVPQEATFVIFPDRITDFLVLSKKIKNARFIVWDILLSTTNSCLDIKVFGRRLWKINTSPLLDCFAKCGRLVSIDKISRKFLRVDDQNRHMVKVLGIPVDSNVATLEPPLPTRLDRAVYIGRAVRWKTVPLCSLFSRYIDILGKLQWKPELTVYTDDRELFLSQLQEAFSSCRKVSLFDFCKIDIHEGVSLPEIDKNLQTFNGIGFAMGTSQFELMKHNIVCFLLPATVDTDRLKEFPFFFCHALPDYVFGCETEQMTYFSELCESAAVDLEKLSLQSLQDLNKLPQKSVHRYSSNSVSLRLLAAVDDASKIRLRKSAEVRLQIKYAFDRLVAAAKAFR